MEQYLLCLRKTRQMKNLIFLAFVSPLAAFSQNIIILQAANPAVNATNVNYQNKLNNGNAGVNNDVQYAQVNINDQNDNNPVQLAQAGSTGAGISLPKISLPSFAWKPSAAGGGKAKKHTAAKKIFLSKKKFKKLFGKAKKIKATASCSSW